MKFMIRDVGLVKYADIELNGLVIIAGENDTGKSTVGKLLYSIIRALSKYEEEFESDRQEFLLRRAESIYVTLRRAFDFTNNEKLRSMFGSEMIDSINKLLSEKKNEELNLVLNKYLEIINDLEFEDQIAKEKIKTTFDSMLEMNSIGEDSLKIQKLALNKVLSSEFINQFSTISAENPSTVEATDGKNPIFSLSVLDNEVVNLNIDDNIFYNEAIYIESPHVLQLFPALLRKNLRGSIFSNVNYQNNNYPLHISDLLASLYLSGQKEYSIAEALSEEMNLTESVVREISHIIGGDFHYEKDTREFLYKKKFGSQIMEIKLPNIATGIKSFGILQLLIKNGSLKERNLLIIDEPEVNLHPKWQIKYAEIIVILSQKLNLNIVLTSHSPYFIEAIKVFSDKYGYSKNTKFYLAEKELNAQNSVIRNVTDDLSLIFEKLTEPFTQLESEAVDD